MKQLLKSLNPKQIFRVKKSRSVSKSAPPSFAHSYSSFSSSDASSAGKSLHSAPIPASGDWSDGESPATRRFDFIQAFKMMDLDGDGKITSVELESVLRRIGGGKLQPPTAEEVAAMIGDIDADNDGCISLEELRKVGSVFESPADGEEELREVFDVFDADHDGKITAEELHEVLSALGDARCTLADCRRMIAGVDKNGDGFVCFEDFTRMMDLSR